MSVLKVTDLNVTIGNTLINTTPTIIDLNLDLNEGDILGLLGRNGCGKTTFIRALTGMIPYNSGSISFFGKELRNHSFEIKKRFGYVPQDLTFPTYLTAAAYIDLHRQIFPTWDETFAHHLEKRFDFDTYQKLHKLSVGQRAQVTLVCALAHKPELLIMDEPTAGLDPIARKSFLAQAVELLAEKETTVIYATHQLDDVMRLSSKIAFMADKHIQHVIPLDHFGNMATLMTCALENKNRFQDFPDCLHSTEDETEASWLIAKPIDEVHDLLKNQSYEPPHLESVSLDALYERMLG